MKYLIATVGVLVGVLIGLQVFLYSYGEFAPELPVTEPEPGFWLKPEPITLTNTTHPEAVTVGEKLQHASGDGNVQRSAIYVQGEPDNGKPIEVTNGLY